MFKNIMVGIDGSAFSDTALDYALHLAQRLQARLEAIHVVDSRMLEFSAPMSGPGYLLWNAQSLNELQQAFRKRGEGILNAAAQKAEAENVPLVTDMELGQPAQALCEAQSRTELVILGRQGDHAEQAPDSTGSTMDRFIRRAMRSCIVTPAAFRPIHKILVAVDGSASAGRAAHEAAELANALQSPLVILAVAERPEDAPLAQQVINNTHTLVRAHDCAAAGLMAEGNPGVQILKTAADTECDLIILGSHGHGWIYDRLIGSVAAHTVSKSPVPVMLVR